MLVLDKFLREVLSFKLSAFS